MSLKIYLKYKHKIFFHVSHSKQNERSERAAVEAKEEIKEVQRQCQEIVTKARAEKDSKIQECEELRLQVKLIIIEILAFFL